MDPRLLRHYNLELQHLREMGAEFAREFPKIAARLSLDGVEVADPYVERLLEGTAFLAARVQLKLEEEFPRFTQRLLQTVHPQLVTPMPSMAVVQLQPEAGDPGLAGGVVVPRGAALSSRRTPGLDTPCEFRTGAALTLWPVTLTQVRLQDHAHELPLAGLACARQVKAALRLRLRATAGLSFEAIGLDTLRLHFSGADEVAFRLHEQVTGRVLAVMVSGPGGAGRRALPASAVRLAGFDDEEALLPPALPTLQGYRLLQEYFAFPQRYLFADIVGLGALLPRLAHEEIEIDILLGEADTGLAQQVSAESIRLHCVPVINLFPKRAGRSLVTEGSSDFHVVPDRSHPLDFEVHTVTGVRGYAAGNEGEQIFHPLYAAFHVEPPGQGAYYTVQREPRLASERRRRDGARSGYVGSEVFVSVVDTREAPYRRNLRQLAFDTLCTNRDLPLVIPMGATAGDFTLSGTAPVARVVCVKGPSRPYSPTLEAGIGWRLVNQLTLNYLSLLDSSPEEGAAALRTLLELHAPPGDAAAAAQVAGLLKVASRQVVRRLPMPGPIAFGRGLEITLLADDLAFQGSSAYLLGCVLDHFLARYVSINSFVQTVLRTQARGELLRPPPRCGARPLF